jgi:nitroreductase
MRVVSHEALRVIQNRVSITKLIAPAPNAAELSEVFRAAARAPDHGKLQPWRFLVIEEEGLGRLSHIFLAALAKSNPLVSPSVVEKTKNMPFRAPMIIVAIAKCQQSSKVPKLEQIIACGAATQNLLNALFALNYGAVWRTGDLAYDKHVAQSLGLVESEEIIGFIYVGTPELEVPAPPQVDIASIFSSWPGK